MYDVSHKRGTVPTLINKKSLLYNLESKGSFSNGKGDSNENVQNP